MKRAAAGKARFGNHQRRDRSLLDALPPHMTRLRTRDLAYAGVAVTLEPNRVIEARMQPPFQPMEQITASALNALRHGILDNVAVGLEGEKRGRPG